MPKTSKPKFKQGIRLFWLLLSGLSVGWLVGLSVSPVLQVVVASVVAVVVAVVAALAGVRSGSDTGEGQAEPSSLTSRLRSAAGVDPVPIGILTLGLALGATGGVVTRSHELLAQSPGAAAAKWGGTGLSDQEIRRRIFDSLYPVVAADAPRPVDPSKMAALFQVSVGDCQLLAGKRGEELRARLIAVGGQPMAAALEECNSEDCLAAFRRLMCGG